MTGGQEGRGLFYWSGSFALSMPEEEGPSKMLTDVDKPIDKLEDLTEDSPSFLGCGEN
jgi:hypothetical protein